jgi:prephenate dehydrogenase
VKAVCERLAVLGLGLLGGSVAKAARERGVAVRVAGATRRRDVLEAALADGSIDEAGEYEDAARGADLVVLATPVFAMGDVLRRVAPVLADGAVVTDVGSVKGSLADTLPGLLGPGAVYVGSHPMAGSHQKGMAAARSDLFEDAPCVVMESEDAAARERVCALWRGLGARIVDRTPAAHDEDVAWMSHVPHALAFAFARALADAPERAFDVCGPGFRDFTRIARSDAELWSDILSANRKALMAPLQSVVQRLGELARALDAEDVEALEAFIAAARAALSAGEIRGSDHPAETRTPAGAEGRTERGNEPER